MSIIVHNSTELSNAFRWAQGGETIQLAEGDYSQVWLGRKQFDTPVTITSLDPDSPTVFDDRILVENVKGLTFKNIDFTLDQDIPASTAPQLYIKASSGIEMIDLTVAGQVTQPGTGVGYDEYDMMVDGSQPIEGYARGFGISVRWSTDVTIDNVDISEQFVGLTINDVEGITVRNSHFHDIRNDGIDFSQSRDVVIEDNLFDNFKPYYAVKDAWDYGDHADFIQFWATNAYNPMDNVEISGNVMVSGGGGDVQAIFGRSSTDGGDTLPDNARMSNFSIHDNLIMTRHPHAIMIGDTQHTEIYNNTILPDTPIDHLPLHTQGVPYIKVSTGAWTDSNGNWVERNGTKPSDISVHNNVNVNHEVYLAGLSSAAREELNVSATDNTIYSNDPNSANWWGHAYPELAERNGLDLTSVIGNPDGGVQSLAPWLIEAAANIPMQNTGLVPGTDGDDVLYGEGDRPLLAGYDGDDVLIGGNGIDTLYGGNGSDTMTGGERGDLFSLKASRSGEVDVDVITDLNFDEFDAIAITEGAGWNFFGNHYDSTNNLRIFGGTDVVLDHEGDIDELLMHANIDGATNQHGDLEISFDFNGDQRTDYILKILGYSEPTVIEPVSVEGGSGADNLQGSAEGEVINGYGGKDEINGGAGSDTISGGEGADRFIFDIEQGENTDKDVITDFSFDEGDQLVLTFEDSFGFMDRLTSRYLRFEDGGELVVIRSEKALMELTRSSAHAEIDANGDSITLTFDRENDGHGAAGTEYELMLKGDIVEEIAPFL